MTGFSIQEVNKSNFDEARQLIKKGLDEHAVAIFKFVVLKSLRIQILILAFSFAMSWMLQVTVMKFFLIFAFIEFLAFLYIRNWWILTMNFELNGMSSWEEFCRTFLSDEFNRLWVAVHEKSGKIVGTIGVVVFGSYRRFGCGMEVNFTDVGFEKLEKHHISCEIKRLSVSPAFRNMGLAQRLIDRALDHIDEHRKKNFVISKVVLFVNSVQRVAIKIYERNGFEKTNSWQLPCLLGFSNTLLWFYEKRIGSCKQD